MIISKLPWSEEARRLIGPGGRVEGPEADGPGGRVESAEAKRSPEVGYGTCRSVSVNHVGHLEGGE